MEAGRGAGVKRGRAGLGRGSSGGPGPRHPGVQPEPSTQQAGCLPLLQGLGEPPGQQARASSNSNGLWNGFEVTCG